MNPTRKLVTTAAFAALAFLALGVPEAWAQGKKRGRAPRGAITVAEVTITGRILKPLASVDVSRISPKLTLSELRQPFLERIGQAVYDDPF
ncbi:MAG: hypothetical protein HY744_18560 [Deltaproteobacteria bacterium]|nr:hypothetical protein [Deltaproteobacteria bacterium]